MTITEDRSNRCIYFGDKRISTIVVLEAFHINKNNRQAPLYHMICKGVLSVGFNNGAQLQSLVCEYYRLTDKQADRQTDRQTGRQADRHRLTDRQTNR